MQNATQKKHYQKIFTRRLQHNYTKIEQEIIHYIINETKLKNIDNISRTNSYFQFYVRHPEIKWAFLASMVSRNAGWNMTDLQGMWFPMVMDKQKRNQLFTTYERANWLIFHDAFPQLLLYEISKYLNKPLFHLLKAFSVSIFMEIEWQKYWYERQEKRLMYSLIINEQFVIQKPVIEHPFFKKRVFHSLTFNIQEWFHFSQVLFPTLEGELYGFSVYDFRNVKSRIELGKRLAWLLFHDSLYFYFYMFSEKTPHTGSRYDFEQYFPDSKKRKSPFLRVVFPIINHQSEPLDDWYNGQAFVERLQTEPKIPKKFHLTKWYKKKQMQLHTGIMLESLIMNSHQRNP